MSQRSALITYYSHSETLWGGLLAFLVTLAGCNGSVSVEESKQVEVVTEGPQPIAVASEDIHNFGTMEVGETLEHEFTITNEGEAPLKLVKDRSTCKCTMAEFEERIVQPGESTNITLKWIGKVEDPNFSQAAYLKTNDPNNKELALTVQGRVDHLFEILPAGVWNLSEMKSDGPTTFSGTITSRVIDTFEIVSLEADEENISVRAEPMTDEELEAEDVACGYHLKGEIQPGSGLGIYEASIVMHAREGEEDHYSSFYVKGYYAGPLRIIGPAGWKANEMMLVMGRVKRAEGYSVTLTMLLQDNEHGPISVTRVQSQPEFFTFDMKRDDSFKAKNRERYEMTISLPPGSPPLNHNENNPAKIIVETDNPMVPKMNLNVYVYSY